MRYNAYVSVFDGEQRLGKAALAPLAQNINAHVKAKAEDEGWTGIWPCWRVATHLGRPVLRMEASSAGEVRANYWEAHRFLKATGYRANFSPTSATSRAL